MSTSDVSSTPAPLVQGEPRQIHNGVFTIPDQGNPAVPNVGIVVGDQAALVIDTGMGPRNGAYVLDQARRLAGGWQLYLTITHCHPEHGFGAQVFRGPATIIYNRTQHEELRRKGPHDLAMFKSFGPAIADELAGVEFADPDITYAGEAQLDLGGRTALLREWGPAHTAGDQTVSIDGRVLFAGDLAVTRMFPIAPHFPPHDTDADGSHWIRALDQLLATAPQTVVPGHGEVAGREVISDNRDCLAYLLGRVADLKAAGTPAEEAVNQISQQARARWSTWSRAEFIGVTIQALYASAGQAS